MNVSKPFARGSARTAGRGATAPAPARVLVVEDEPLIRAYVSDVLDQSGFAVTEADTADDALKYIADGMEVCAIVSDVAMPGSFDGFELARRVRESFPDMGVILVSGVMAPKDKDMYIPLGVRFLSKPVRAMTLLRLVREVADPRIALPELAPEERP